MIYYIIIILGLLLYLQLTCQLHHRCVLKSPKEGRGVFFFSDDFSPFVASLR